MAKTITLEDAEQKLFGVEPQPAGEGAGEQVPEPPKQVSAWRQQQQLVNELVEARAQVEVTRFQLRSIQSQIDDMKERHGWTDEDVQRFAAEAVAAASAGADAA